MSAGALFAIYFWGWAVLCVAANAMAARPRRARAARFLETAKIIYAHTAFALAVLLTGAKNIGFAVRFPGAGGHVFDAVKCGFLLLIICNFVVSIWRLKKRRRAGDCAGAPLGEENGMGRTK